MNQNAAAMGLYQFSVRIPELLSRVEVCALQDAASTQALLYSALRGSKYCKCQGKNSASAYMCLVPRTSATCCW